VYAVPPPVNLPLQSSLSFDTLPYTSQVIFLLELEHVSREIFTFALETRNTGEKNG